MRRALLVLAVVAVVALVAGCDGGSDRSGTATSLTTPSTSSRPVTGGDGRPGCTPASTFDAAAGNEVHGTSTAGELWGIAMATRLPPGANDPVKIVWRMTGRGPLRVRVTGPGGRTAPLTFGPEPHPGSTYRRPGDEWGTGFRFPQAGCWRIHLARTDTAGDVWIRVT